MMNEAFIEEQGRTSAFDAATAQFSLYGAGINKKESQTPHKQGTLSDAIKWMRSLRIKELTEQLRSIDDPKEQKKFKAEKLPFATFGGTFSYRNAEGLIQRSGLLCFDFDHLDADDEVARVRRLLTADPCLETVLLFTSPRGKGVKWVTYADLENGSHEECYQAVADYLQRTYGLQADPSPKNVASACFLCYDPDLVSCLDQPRLPEAEPDEAKRMVRDVADLLVAKGVDITASYEDWLRLAFALANTLGEEGRAIFHNLSRANSGYDYGECDKKYSNCLKTARGGVTYKSLLHMAKQAGVELPEPYRHAFNLHTGFEAIKSLRPQRPKGQTAKNGQKAEKIAKNDFLGNEWPNGHLAFLAFPEGYTFSDKIAPADWPSFCRGILDSQADTVGRDKMMLGALNIISGLPQRSYYSIYDQKKVYTPLYNIIYGGFASKKGDLLSCKQLLHPLKLEMQRANAKAQDDYADQVAQWEAAPKASRGRAPKEPAKKSLFISANSSAAAFYRTLAANEGFGIVFDTEADAMSTMFAKQEYGDYSDLLRKAHHHEECSITRVTDNISIVVDEPCLAVLLTCTGSQLPALLNASNIANGLASRFLFYALPSGQAEFRDVFAHSDLLLDDVFRSMSRPIERLHKALMERRERPIQFVMTQDQQQRFLALFKEMLQEKSALYGEGIDGFIFRLGLECYRYAMVLSLLRRLSSRPEADTPLFDPDEQALACDDRDLGIAVAIVECLVMHTTRVYSVIGQDDSDPFAKAPKQPSAQLKAFYDALPADRDFTTAEATHVAESIQLSARSARRYLGELLSTYQALAQPRRGEYRKARKEAQA